MIRGLLRSRRERRLQALRERFERGELPHRKPSTWARLNYGDTHWSRQSPEDVTRWQVYPVIDGR